MFKHRPGMGRIQKIPLLIILVESLVRMVWWETFYMYSLFIIADICKIILMCYLISEV